MKSRIEIEAVSNPHLCGRQFRLPLKRLMEFFEILSRVLNEIPSWASNLKGGEIFRQSTDGRRQARRFLKAQSPKSK
ncbi:MAG: hypothetical protein ACK56I_28890, partial [bacterium]